MVKLIVIVEDKEEASSMTRALTKFENDFLI